MGESTPEKIKTISIPTKMVLIINRTDVQPFVSCLRFAMQNLLIQDPSKPQLDPTHLIIPVGIEVMSVNCCKFRMGF